MSESLRVLDTRRFIDLNPGSVAKRAPRSVREVTRWAGLFDVS